MKTIIALGSNLGDRKSTLDKAIQRLNVADGVRVIKTSPFYETEPVGNTDQGLFINAAVMVETSLSSHELLAVCQGIENSLGRVRTIHWGPRTLDLDIILCEDMVIDTPELKVPHPLMHERLFVLEPVRDIAPNAVHPVVGKTISEIIEGMLR